MKNIFKYPRKETQKSESVAIYLTRTPIFNVWQYNHGKYFFLLFPIELNLDIVILENKKVFTKVVFNVAITGKKIIIIAFNLLKRRLTL